MTAVIILVAIAVVLIVFIIALYNKLVKLRNMVDNAWAQIDVQLQRRLDLIPNVVETVKGYAQHESATLDAVGANNHLTETLKSLFAVAEAYPDLKANANFQQLQAELSNTEDKISYMRQSFNDTVMKYNTAIQTFPAVLFAGVMGFKERPSFTAEEGASAAPKVTF